MIDPSGGPAMICAFFSSLPLHVWNKRNQAALVAPLLFLFSFFFEESLGATQLPQMGFHHRIYPGSRPTKNLERAFAWQKIKTCRDFSFWLLRGFFHLRIFGNTRNYCWWFKNRANQLIRWNFPLFTMSFIHVTGLFGISEPSTVCWETEGLWQSQILRCAPKSKLKGMNPIGNPTPKAHNIH